MLMERGYLACGWARAGRTLTGPLRVAPPPFKTTALPGLRSWPDSRAVFSSFISGPSGLGYPSWERPIHRAIYTPNCYRS